MKRLFRYLSALWQRFLTRWVVYWNSEKLKREGKKALRRLVLEGLVPPDTLSMGVLNGGRALYFKHDKGTDVTIGSSYEELVDTFIREFKERKARGPAYVPTTTTTTKFNRHERRAYASNKFRNSQKVRKK